MNGDTDRWNTNTGTTGVIVNGDNVTATGLFVEHFQTYNTLWNGENGRVILYQNELPYDPPTQADWTQPDGTLGYPGYKVADDVTTHRLDGAGVYVFNQNNPSILTANGFEVPETPGVQLHHIMTVNLSAGTIEHVVNGVGGPADNTNIGVPSYIVDYPDAVGRTMTDAPVSASAAGAFGVQEGGLLAPALAAALAGLGRRRRASGSGLGRPSSVEHVEVNDHVTLDGRGPGGLVSDQLEVVHRRPRAR